MSKKGKLGLLFGLLAGSAFGFLFAPKKGKDLRKKMHQEYKKSGSMHKTAFGELKNVGKEVKDTANYLYEQSGLDDEVEELAGKAKKEAKKIEKKAKGKMKDMTDKVKEQLGKDTE